MNTHLLSRDEIIQYFSGKLTLPQQWELDHKISNRVRFILKQINRDVDWIFWHVRDFKNGRTQIHYRSNVTIKYLETIPAKWLWSDYYNDLQELKLKWKHHQNLEKHKRKELQKKQIREKLSPAELKLIRFK